jgi:hypothetical protein
MPKLQRSLSSTLTLLLVFLFGFRLYLQASFPVIGDEAYYFYWGHHVAGGYYDLPPMIGWWERFFTFFSDESFWLRLPNLFVILAVTFGMREWLSVSTTRGKATTTSLLYFFSPIPFLAVLISHDVSLLLFTFFSALLYFRGYQVKDSWKEFLISGSLWGGAFLSKYFALFVLPFYVIWFLTRKKEQRSLKKVAWFTLGAFPFVFQHFYWNANHCWANFVFNLVTRQQIDDGPIYKTFGMFVLYLLILLTPVFWPNLIARSKKKWFKSRSELESFFLGMWLMPIFIFGATALAGKGQGIHWYLPYLPFFFLWVGLRFPLQILKRKLRQMMYFTYGLSMIALVALVFPDQTLGRLVSQRFPLEYQIAFHGKEWAEKIATELNTSMWCETDLLVTDGYSQASVLDHELHRYFLKDYFWTQSSIPPVAVWGGGSRFGRVFDWTVDYSKFDGKNVALVSRSLMPSADWSQYFEESRVSQKELNGQKFWLFMGRGFYAQKYINAVMKPAWKTFYPKFFLENSITSKCELRD